MSKSTKVYILLYGSEEDGIKDEFCGVYATEDAIQAALDDFNSMPYGESVGKYYYEVHLINS